MSVNIVWDVSAAGRNVGDQETVEQTEFVDGVLANGYAHIVSEPIVGVFQADPLPVEESPVVDDSAPVVEPDPTEVSAD